MQIARFKRTARFEREFKRLDPQLQARVEQVLESLKAPHLPGALRHHTLNGYCPTIHVVDVTSNHSHQVTFNWIGDEAILLRVSTHRHIDSNPE